MASTRPKIVSMPNAKGHLYKTETSFACLFAGVVARATVAVIIVGGAVGVGVVVATIAKRLLVYFARECVFA